MSTLFEQLAEQLGPTVTQQIGRSLGVGEEQAGSAVSAAVPMLLGGLARNTADPQGASALLGALDRDHDGSVLDDVGGFLGGGGAATANGAGILEHVLGNKQ
jgi:hypothetical protein